MSMLTQDLQNRLQFEKSPYLLQHASNPVAWQPWDDQALELASSWQRPIFLSIGYSTCHWCHVMAEESFCDTEVAELLNRHYIAIKVDREERPDLDTVYMHACQMLIGHGGWPLNLLLTPTGHPFYALTYVPRLSRAGSPGLIDILTRIASLWQEQPDNLNQAASEVVAALRNRDEPPPEQPLEVALLNTAADNLRNQYDQQQGGFGQPPKFPQPHNLSLLLRLSQRLEDPDLERMAVETLRRIDCGGITDQLGGGLHRYSVDARWLVPHFEKMLYDQALISDAYLDAWQVTADPLFSEAAMRTCSYVLRDLGHPQGGFYCGEDADSEGHEGTFYLWSAEELREALNKSEFSRFAHIYGITPAGNFSGKNILHRDPAGAGDRPTNDSQSNNLDADLDAIRERLKQLRQQRLRPHLDDKLLTGWNGLMIAALARAGRLLPCSECLAAAEQAWQVIRDHLSGAGQLLRRYRDGDAAIDAFHEDYAYLIRGLIELFLSTGKRDYLEAALDYQSNCNDLFGDDQGGYYDAAKPFTNDLGRSRSRQDGALPAAASVTAHNLLRLARITGRQTLAEQAVTLLRQHLNLAADHPTAFAFLLQALDLALSKPLTLVVVKPDDQALQQPWLKVLRQFRPNLLTLVISSASKLADLVPHCAGKTTIRDTTTAWLCTENSCLPPVTEAAQLESILQSQDSLKTLSR